MAGSLASLSSVLCHIGFVLASADLGSAENTEHVSLLQTKAQIRNGKNMGQMHERADLLLERTATNSTAGQSSGWLSMQQLADMMGSQNTQSQSKLTSTVILQNRDNAGLPKHGFVHFLTENPSEAAKVRQRVVETVVTPTQNVTLSANALTQPAEVLQQLAASQTADRANQESNVSDVSPTVKVPTPDEVPTPDKVPTPDEVPTPEWVARSAKFNESQFQQLISSMPHSAETVPKPPPSMNALHALSPVVEDRLNVLVRDALDIRGVFAALQTNAAETEAAEDPDETLSPLPPLAFIKTHRTGSSTIANIIHRLGDQRGLSFLLPNGDKAQALGWPGPFPGPDFSAKPTHSFDVICNNAVYAEEHMRRFLKPSPFFFTVLRQPVTQVQSAFNFFDPPCGNDWDARMAWLEKVVQTQDPSEEFGSRGPNFVAQFRNSQAHDLGWYERQGQSSEFDHDDKAINAWIEEIHDSLGFVMLAEYFNEGLLLLGKKLGLRIRDLAHIRLKSSNDVKGEQGNEGPLPAQAQNIEHLAHVDVLLYTRFNRTFWHAWDNAGGYDELDGELQELRLRNEALEAACSKKNEQVCPWKFRTDNVEYTEVLRKSLAEVKS